MYGYYRSADPWVIRRHAQLLADAGVDTLILDATNAETYRTVYLALCKVFQEVRQTGGRAPQLAFMLNTQAGATAQTLYNEFYKPGAVTRRSWFRWQGKPLLICDPTAVTPELREFFTLRAAHWPFTLTNTPYAWHWEATYPQPYGYTDDPNQPEQVVVSVAQNLRAKDGKVTNMSSGEARGRSFHDGQQDPSAGRGEPRLQRCRSNGSGLSNSNRLSCWSPAGTNGSPDAGANRKGRWCLWTNWTRNSAATSSR